MSGEMMFVWRLAGVSLLSICLVLTGANASAAVQPNSDELLLPLPDGVWIKGTKVKLVDTKSCWVKNEKPVLYAMVGGNFKAVAQGKLIDSSECSKKFPFEAVYRFTLKEGGGAKKLTLRSGGRSADYATYKRTVYSSTSEYNDYAAKLLGVFEDMLTGDPSSSGSPSGGGSPASSSGWSGCYFNGKKMWGTVKIVDSGFADFDVKIVDYFSDLKVKDSRFPTSCGEWKLVESGFADFTVKFVDYFADFSVEFVDYFPGR